ncbi:MAG: hypothetical protein IJY93_04305 [Clostridia bacterium]|nr:hypothetical protein [Clostridia bacterium]
MKNAFTKINETEINNVTRKDNETMKNNTITLTENDLRLCSAILNALNDYRVQRTPGEDFSSAYSTSDERDHEAIMERYEYIEEQKALLRNAIEDNEDFDFHAYLDENGITNKCLRKILDREFDAYWDEVMYAKENPDCKNCDSDNNTPISLTENDLRVCYEILRAMNDYYALGRRMKDDTDDSSVYESTDNSAITECRKYIKKQKTLLRDAIHEQNDDFDFGEFLTQNDITDYRLVKILEREFETYWDELAYANESTEA